MPRSYFQFKQFTIHQVHAGMKVTTDACLFGAWVADVIQSMPSEPVRILDIGSGTGLLSLMIAQKTVEAHITAIELNRAAFSECQNNFRQSPWHDRLSCLNVALQRYQPAERYDVIVSNPPFFAKSLKGRKQNKNEALHADLLPQSDLLEGISNLLAGNGAAFVLYPDQEMQQFSNSAAVAGLHQTACVNVRHTEEGSPFRTLAKYEFLKRPGETVKMEIKTKAGKYSPSFWQLLQDYYLEYNNPEKG